jgi:uncharacterized protein (UPF0332 family)
MAIIPSDFMLVSDSLLGVDKCAEMHWRSAASRAYYNVYHEAKLKADELGLPDVQGKNMGSHSRLVARFKSSGKRLKVIGVMLDNARGARNDADYGLNNSYTLAEARKDIYTCRTLISEISRLCSNKTAEA